MPNWLHVPHRNAERNTPVVSPEEAADIAHRQQLADEHRGAFTKKRGVIERYIAYMYEDRQKRSLALGGLGRVILHRKGGVITSTDPESTFSRINFGVTYDGQVPIVEVAVHPLAPKKEQSYRYIGAPSGPHIETNQQRYPLFHPLASEGLERVTEVCLLLGRAVEAESIELPFTDEELAELGLLDAAA